MQEYEGFVKDNIGIEADHDSDKKEIQAVGSGNHLAVDGGNLE